MAESYEDDALDSNAVAVAPPWILWRVVLNAAVATAEDPGVWVVWISAIYSLEAARRARCIPATVDVNNMPVWDFHPPPLDPAGPAAVPTDGNL